MADPIPHRYDIDATRLPDRVDRNKSCQQSMPRAL
jgi:hypothetical protein